MKQRSYNIQFTRQKKYGRTERHTKKDILRDTSGYWCPQAVTETDFVNGGYGDGSST